MMKKAICPHCQAPYDVDEDYFCGNCGKRLKEGTAPVSDEVQATSKVQENHETAFPVPTSGLFCSFCGTRMGSFSTCVACGHSHAKNARKYCRLCGGAIGPGKKCTACHSRARMPWYERIVVGVDMLIVLVSMHYGSLCIREWNAPVGGCLIIIVCLFALLLLSPFSTIRIKQLLCHHPIGKTLFMVFSISLCCLFGLGLSTTFLNLIFTKIRANPLCGFALIAFININIQFCMCRFPV